MLRFDRRTNNESVFALPSKMNHQQHWTSRSFITCSVLSNTSNSHLFIYLYRQMEACIPLLPSSIPNLKACLFSIYKHLFHLKTHPYISRHSPLLFIWHTLIAKYNINVYCSIYFKSLPRVVCMSPLNSFRLRRSKKLDLPDPASPANTKRNIGTDSSESNKSVSVCCKSEKFD